jgi:fatty-acyl-CoA synthase
MSQQKVQPPDQAKSSAAKDWLRALQLTAPIAHSPERVFPAVIEELGERFGDAPALLSDRECLTYRGLAQRTNQYARWAIEHGVEKGETVCLFMPNRPEYLAIWLGIAKVGGVVALLNTNLVGPSLAHSINVVKPRHIIAAAELSDSLATVLPDIASCSQVWIDVGDALPFQRIDRELAKYSGDALSEEERRTVTLEDQALYIYTSGTTGWPKAAQVSHGRIMQWSHWFAGMMDTRSADRMYNCLPMYHSVGGVQAPGAVLLGGGSVVIREKFSASQFWADIERWDCTLFQYIGELCRYLLHSDASPHEKAHRIRMACGNGLRPDVWRAFQDRFGIPRILEFYAATEGAVSLFNAEGEPGAIGRFPSFLGHRSPVVLVRFDVDKEEPVRDERGFCVRCEANEPGEAIGPLQRGAHHVSNRFEGYSSPEASEKKIVRNVFEQGDAWFRTGDLMRKDERGFFYFVDRIGDTFRWKGENVAASEVSEAICAAPGVKQASVYGVAIPGAEGKAGMAVLVPDGDLNLRAFRADLMSRLPNYACPLFLRIRNEMELTTTFKYTKAELVRQGYNPLSTGDPIYFNHPDRKAFVRLDKGLYDQIAAGQVRL